LGSRWVCRGQLAVMWCGPTAHCTHCHAFKRCCRNAVSEARQYRSSLRNVAPLCRLLGGLLLFVFLVSSRAGSWLDIESVCSTCCVCDMAAISARLRGFGGGRVLQSLLLTDESEERGG
jgi:hypothetical protein